MVVAPRPAHIAAAALVVLAAAVPTAGARAQSAVSLAEGDGIFIDGRNFEIVHRKGPDDAGRLVKALGAREIGPGAIIFRAGDRLYIADAPARLPAGAAKGKQRSIRMCYEFVQVMLEELPNETAADGTTRNDALIGQLALVLLHEAGHAIYDIFEVPILGSQEDAADQFASYVMLQFGGQRAYRLIRGAAHAFRRIIAKVKDKPDVTLPLTAFSSDHSRPEQRFFNMACSAYGYDAKLFASVVDEEWLPEKRAKRCKHEYEDLTFAMRRLVGPHVDKALARKVLDTRWLSEESPAAPQ